MPNETMRDGIVVGLLLAGLLEGCPHASAGVRAPTPAKHPAGTAAGSDGGAMFSNYSTLRN